ncbi:Hypothetical protein DHA2_16070 [Giardia duodenalis]|uniref:Uncharacterized protein n=1 Tax=Giardia intestinalis TaxID=5741 RepID=V6TAN0_GIAIN|nr:Hypothetical protein DHA2_16070 [Giardia intestinalis]
MEVDQIVNDIYVSEARAATSGFSQPSYASHTSQDISLEFIRAMTADTSTSGIPPYKEASIRSTSPYAAYKVNFANDLQYGREESPIDYLEDDLSRLLIDSTVGDLPLRSQSLKQKSVDENARKDSSFAGIRSLRSGELPAKQLLMSSQSSRSSSFMRTPAGSMIRWRPSTGGPRRHQGTRVEASTSYLSSDPNGLRASSVRGRPMTDADITQQVFHVLNCLKLSHPSTFYINRSGSQSILAFSAEDNQPLESESTSDPHMPSSSQAMVVLKVDFPDQLKMCTYNMVYFGFYSLFDGLLEDDQGFLVGDSSYLTVSEVEPFCIAMARHVLEIVQSYNKYVNPSVAIERLRSSSSITVPFVKCIYMFKKELKARRLTTIPRYDQPGYQRNPSSTSSSFSSAATSTSSFKGYDEVISHCNKLYSLHEKKQAKQLEIDRQRAEEETSGCTFRPELNDRSIELSTRKRIYDGTATVKESIENSIENYTVKVRSLNELDDYTKIITKYLYDLKLYAMNQRILSYFPDDHVIWEDAYHALRANTSLKYREEMMDEFKERMVAEARSKSTGKPQTAKVKLNYKPGESILDATAQLGVCYYNKHLKNVKDGKPYRMDERQKRNMKLVKQGVLRPEFAGMTDQTFKDLPIVSKMHTVDADRQTEYQEREGKAEQRVAAVKPYLRGGGDVTSLVGETGMGEIVQATLNTKMGSVANLDNDPLVSSPVLLDSLTKCLSMIKAITEQEDA